MANQLRLDLPDSLTRFGELAYNMWFSWNDDAVELFRQVNPGIWEDAYHNPVRVLQETPRESLEALVHNESFMTLYRQVISKWDEYLNRYTWYMQEFPQHKNKIIAYFSAEFGFHESMPIYSGGLGVLAGDHCKSASDLGLPLVAVGLMYKKGYFNQKIDVHGSQVAELVQYDFNKLAIQPAMSGDNELVIAVDLPGRSVKLKVWTIRVGIVPVYLLDADIDGNSPEDRGLTAQLYGGNQDTRIQQEIILGVGGIKALRELNLYPYVYHINEGHAAFLSLERLREHISGGLSYSAALEMIRASTVFTTHTPVPAGHDAFPIGMFEHYMSGILNALPHERESIIHLGLDRSKNVFNMTYLAMNTATLRNGVSRLHGEVSREMFRSFHGNLHVHEIPIRFVTNGVHMRTWLAREMKELLDRHLPLDWRNRQTDKGLWHGVTSIPDDSLWQVHKSLKSRLIDFARANLKNQRRRNGESEEAIAEVDSYLDPNALTIGFARRFATYKRATLIFNNHDRLDRLVNNPERPVQFIFAGKAHPADHPGQELLREIYRVSRMDRFKGKVVLLENYDMNMARHLVQGVDVWLNNPRRPYEASGTSGQKAAMNGVLNFSVLDGWWEEGFDGKNGWSITANNRADFETQERENTESLYTVLEQDIVPRYYDKNGTEHSPSWVEWMKHSIFTLAPAFNTDRMVQDYTNQCYGRTISRAERFSANNYEGAVRMSDYKQFIRSKWSAVKVVSITDPTPSVGFQESIEKHLTKPVSVTVHLGDIWFRDVSVEAIYWADQQDGTWVPVIVPFQLTGEAVSPNTYLYEGKVPAHLMHGPHYQFRIRPVSPDFAVDFELTEMTMM